MSKLFDDNSVTIGNTPMVKLKRITDANIYAKLESRNPANSVKCRIGANMVWDAEKSGILKSGMTIVEPTSGNTGIALAFVAAARGYKIKLTMPHTMSLERRKLMKAYGAEIVITDGAKGMKAAIAKAEEIVAENPDTHWMPQQFENPANPAVHEATTGPEIWEDSGGDIDAIVAGVGTGGTITGATRYLKGKNPNFKAFAVEPIHSAVISGEEPGKHRIQGIGAGFIPGNLDESLVDGVVKVEDEDAFTWARRLAVEEGIMAGISSGANMYAAAEIAARPEFAGKRIVTILPSLGERYLSTDLFEGLTG